MKNKKNKGFVKLILIIIIGIFLFKHFNITTGDAINYLKTSAEYLWNDIFKDIFVKFIVTNVEKIISTQNITPN